MSQPKTLKKITRDDVRAWADRFASIVTDEQGMTEADEDRLFDLLDSAISEFFGHPDYGNYN